jgi:hypothetical protein
MPPRKGKKTAFMSGVRTRHEGRPHRAGLVARSEAENEDEVRASVTDRIRNPDRSILSVAVSLAMIGVAVVAVTVVVVAITVVAVVVDDGESDQSMRRTGTEMRGFWCGGVSSTVGHLDGVSSGWTSGILRILPGVLNGDPVFPIGLNPLVAELDGMFTRGKSLAAHFRVIGTLVIDRDRS